MIRQDPILIASPPRSGTTMLAGLLHYHGVWVGRSRTTRYPGTNSNFGSENIDIKAVMKDMAVEVGYKNWSVPAPNPVGFDGEQARRRINSFVPEDVPWLVKTAWCLLFWEFWETNYPDARWVFPKRDPEKIVDSMNRHPGMRSHPDSEKYNYISALTRCMSDAIDTGIRYTYVDIEKLSDRDEDTLEHLFEFLEIKMDPEIVESWIKPEMFKK